MQRDEQHMPGTGDKKPWVKPVAQSVTLSPQASDALT
jgi:hypothetical protein